MLDMNLQLHVELTERAALLGDTEGAVSDLRTGLVVPVELCGHDGRNHIGLVTNPSGLKHVLFFDHEGAVDESVSVLPWARSTVAHRP